MPCLYLILELDNSGVVEDPDDFMPEYPPIGDEVSEEMMDKATEKRNEAMAAVSDGKLQCMSSEHKVL